ncbi:MAG: dapL [Acidimicrobiaceae bacterium]|nr:dapL [Acidimicrobiaceae bacterium]
MAERARAHDGGMVDLSVGTPCDPPPAVVLAELASSGGERGYPSGVGSARLLDAGRSWIERRFAVPLERRQIAACVGTKELVAGLPHWLRLRSPGRDTVLYPAVSYPTYAMGALLAGARPVPVPLRADGAMDLAAISEEDAARALCLWVNSPSNPTGDLDDLAAAAEWGRRSGVLVCSDECYAEFTWVGSPRTILESGTDGVLAVHSLSKRSNAAGLRCGLYAGDGEIVSYLAELRRHAGLMVPGPIQAAAAGALEDDEHVMVQRERYLGRLARFADLLGALGLPAPLPGGGFYLWVGLDADSLASLVGDEVAGEPLGWRFTRWLAETAGTLVSPGDFYADSAADHVRVAMVQPDERVELVAKRLGLG